MAIANAPGSFVRGFEPSQIFRDFLVPHFKETHLKEREKEAINILSFAAKTQDEINLNFLMI
jgi:hypothetical protein